MTKLQRRQCLLRCREQLAVPEKEAEAVLRLQAGLALHSLQQLRPLLCVGLVVKVVQVQCKDHVRWQASQLRSNSSAKRQ